ncbi:MAG: endolytic transglycosylase MltG [Clostridiales bacterium]|nr:endolytic transglycosylase MltG [Clostridiales bacterium]
MFLRIVKAGLGLSLFLLLVGVVWLVRDLYEPRTLPGQNVLFDVEKGAGIKAVARRLDERGLIRSNLSFLAAYQLFYAPRKIKAGEYAFSSPVRVKDVLEDLVSGKIHLHAVTIPEGLTAREIAPLLGPLLADGEEGFMAAFYTPAAIAPFDPEATDLEGYLFPETYSFPKGVASEEAVRSMVGQFNHVFGASWRERARSMGLSLREAVTLASLIEKETSVPAERPLVSAVFHNRLRLGMKLDCDPTIIYALKQKGIFNGNLSKKDMALDSPYNTYRHAGLPPGPICNPGRESLEAALFPSDEGYIYFVSRNDGSHHFSRSFAEHQAAVRRFQKRGL